MGPEGDAANSAFKGYDGATWTIPGGEASESDDAAIGRPHDPLVNYTTPGDTTPSFNLTPGHPSPWGVGWHHGPPPAGAVLFAWMSGRRLAR